MNTRQHGFSSRTLARSFEHFHHRLLRLGYSEQDATRGAAALAAFEAKCTREQAWETADEIAAQRKEAAP